MGWVNDVWRKTTSTGAMKPCPVRLSPTVTLSSPRRDCRMAPKRFLDEVVGVGDSDDSDAESAPSSSKTREEPVDAKVTVDDLRRAGYQSGPSVLFVPKPKEDAKDSWAWDSGRKPQDGEEEEDRQETRERVGAVEESAEHMRRAAEMAARLAEEKRLESEKRKEQLKKDKRLTWNEKEGRKRARGQQGSGLNFVEEEKRRARQQHGMYTNFD